MVQSVCICTTCAGVQSSLLPLIGHQTMGNVGTETTSLIHASFSASNLFLQLSTTWRMFLKLSSFRMVARRYDEVKE